MKVIDCEQGMCIVSCRDGLHLVNTVSKMLAMIKLDIQDYASKRPWLDAVPQPAARIYLDQAGGFRALAAPLHKSQALQGS